MNSLRFFWLAIFALLIGIASYLAEELFFPIQPFSHGSFESKIHEDVRKLKEKAILPKEIDSLQEVFISDRRDRKTLLDWQKLSALDFPRKPDGQYDLQIEILDAGTSSTHPKEEFEIIQFSLFEHSTKNKIWEISRQYFNDSKNDQPK